MSEPLGRSRLSGSGDGPGDIRLWPFDRYVAESVTVKAFGPNDAELPTEVVLTKINLPTSQLEPIEDMERIALIRKDAARHYYAKRFADESVEYTAFMERLDGEAMEQINNRRDKPSWRDEAEGAAA